MVEFIYEYWGNVFCCYPLVMLVAITFPFDLVLDCSCLRLISGEEDLLYLI